MEKKKLLIDLHYLPSVAYFTLLSQYDEVVFEAHEHYIKQTFRNRCYILTSNKIDRLTVPVASGAKNRPVTEVEVDYKEKWANRHWRAISSAYAKAPFFEYYCDYFEQEIYQRHQYLFDLNFKLLTVCLKILGLKTKVGQTDSYQRMANGSYHDYRSCLLPNTKVGIIHVQEYSQLFTENFVENLSILDLLFNEGPNSLNLLKKQAVKLA